MEQKINISVIPKFVDNILDKPSKTMGQILSDIFYLVLGGELEYRAEKRRIAYAEKLKIYQEEISAAINAIPKDKLGEADVHLVGSILEHSKYCLEKDELRRLFVNLIAASVNIEKKKYVHPLFGEILSKISDLDAKVLYLIALNTTPEVDISVTVDELAFALVVLIELGIIVDIKRKREDDYQFDIFSHLYYLILEQYTKGILHDTKNGDHITSIKDYIICDIDFLHKFLWRNFKMTRLGQNLANTCIL